MTAPLVSILMATLDEAEFARVAEEMRRTVRGIDHEIVACTPFEAKGAGVVWVRDENPRGSVAAFNTAFATARGDYVSLVTDSKTYEPGWLDKSLAYLSARRASAPLAACMKMGNPLVGEDVVGTVFGKLYPWVWTQARADFERLGGYFLNPRQRSFAADLDLGMRIWAAGGRCAIVPGARYTHLAGAPRVRTGAAGKSVEDFETFCRLWYPTEGAGYGELLPDGRMGAAPETVAYDIPESFFPAFVRDDTIRIADRRGFPSWGWLLAWAPAHARDKGVAIPPDVLAEPARVVAWLNALGVAAHALAR